MIDKPPRTRPPDTFASFDADALGQGTRRKPRYVINPMRGKAHASAEASRLAGLEAAIAQGLGMRPVKE